MSIESLVVSFRLCMAADEAKVLGCARVSWPGLERREPWSQAFCCQAVAVEMCCDQAVSSLYGAAGLEAAVQNSDQTVGELA